MDKSKKRKIIVAIVCVVVLIVGIIASVLLITRKRFDITNDTFHYNDHTTMYVDRMDSNLVVSNGKGSTSTNPEYYSNGTVMVNRKETAGYGIYSYIQGKLIIPTNYNTGNLIPIKLDNHLATSDEYIFFVGTPLSGTNTIMSYYTDEGRPLDIVVYEKETNENYVKIKQKHLSLEEKRSGIKVKTKNKFYTQAVAVSNVQYVTSYVGENYNYERWQITAKDGTIYENLYSVECNGDRQLIQTINNTIGHNIDTASTELGVLDDGELRLVTTTPLIDSTDQTTISVTISDINFKEKGSFTININDSLSTYFPVGNSAFLQMITPATEKKYDYAQVNDDSTISYYKLATYQIDYEDGDYEEVDCDFVVDGSPSNKRLGSSTMLTAKMIDGKMLGDSTNIIVNEDLKVKTINYTIDKVTKIKKDRYLVENNLGLLLIDDDYKLICNLGDHDDYFTTKESVILINNNSGHTYVVDLDGTVVKRCANGQITNIFDDTYYMIEVENEDGSVSYFTERLGVRKNLIYTENNSLDHPQKHTYNGKTYLTCSFDVLSDELSIITRVREGADNTYIYDFYNIDGDLLLTLTNFTTTERTLTYWDYTDDNHSIVHISTNVGGEEYFMVVDR